MSNIDTLPVLYYNPVPSAYYHGYPYRAILASRKAARLIRSNPQLAMVACKSGYNIGKTLPLEFAEREYRLKYSTKQPGWFTMRLLREKHIYKDRV